MIIMSELLHIRAGDSDFSVTVGRSTAGFVYGTRSLPDDVDGIPAFIMDSTPLLVNQMTGTVERDSSQVFTYGGSDGRDLLSRSEMIPKGQFSFTRSDLSVTRHEEDHEDGTTTLTTTKEFDVAGTIRRVTGDIHVSVELGQDSLGTIIPGVDIHVGDHILLEVWEQTLELVVSSYRHSSTGWMMTVESVVQAPTLSKTNEMVQRWRTPSERIEQLSKEVRDIKANYESDSMIPPVGGESGPTTPTPEHEVQKTYYQYIQGPPGTYGNYGVPLIEQVSHTQDEHYYMWEYEVIAEESIRSGLTTIAVSAPHAQDPNGHHNNRIHDTFITPMINGSMIGYVIGPWSQASHWGVMFNGNRFSLRIVKEAVGPIYDPEGPFRHSPFVFISITPTVIRHQLPA